MGNKKIENLKNHIFEQIKKQGFADAILCKQLICVSEQEGDIDNLAIGHLLLAEFFLDKENKIECKHELEIAQKYININKPNEILEKYYFIEYKFYSDLYDTKTAFDFCLKSLDIAEQIYKNPALDRSQTKCFVTTVENRIVCNYGNIGINFFNQDIYDKAIVFCKRALNILESLDVINKYSECLLRLVLIINYARTEMPQEIEHHLQLMKKLPIDKKCLKIYLDYAYLNFCTYKKDIENIKFYTNEILNDQVEIYTDRLTAIDFYIEILKPIIELEIKKSAQLLFKEIERLIHDDEIKPLLKLANLKIIYANIFDEKEKEQELYQEYFDLYLKNEKNTNSLIVNGLKIRLKLYENEIDNTKEKKQIHILEDVANYDELTQIFNRRYLEIKYEELVNNNVNLLSLAIVDIDHFKEYNDNYGHLAGDDILKKVSSCLQKTILEDMMVCRYGGDEFVVLNWCKTSNNIQDFAEKIKKAIDTMRIEHKKSPISKYMTVSIGLGSKNIKAKEDINTLFEEVDKALYIAKKQGRDQIVKIS